MSFSAIELLYPEDIARFLSTQAGTITQYRQFSPGPANLRYQVVDLQGVTLLWAAGDAHALWRDHVHSGAEFRFGFVLNAAHDVFAQGVEIGPDHAVVWVDGAETEYLFKGAIETLEMVVHADIADQLGWKTAGTVLNTAHPGTLQTLATVCQSASTAMRSAHENNSQHLALYWREQVLNAIEPAVWPWLDFDANDDRDAARIFGDYSCFRSAEAVFLGGTAASPDIAELSKRVGVSRRKLELAFRKCAGVGPRRYFEVQRLHDLRAKLLAGRSDQTSVTRQAMDHGFGDLGRMAQKYRTLFGEYPSDTLRLN